MPWYWDRIRFVYLSPLKQTPSFSWEHHPVLGYSSIGNVVNGLGLKESCLQEMGQLVQEKPLDFMRQNPCIVCLVFLMSLVEGKQEGGATGTLGSYLDKGLFSLSPTSFDELDSSLITSSWNFQDLASERPSEDCVSPEKVLLVPPLLGKLMNLLPQNMDI